MAEASGNGGRGAPGLRVRGQATRRRLLDAGVEVFSKRGFHAARVDDVVKRARTSHGTFYLYFANKEDLFRALAQDVADQMAELAASLGPLTPDEQGYRELREWLGRFEAVYSRWSPIIAAWTESETETSEVVRLGNQVLGRFTVALADQIRRAPIDDLDPQVAAMALVALIERFHYYAATGLVEAGTDALLDTLAALAHGSLFGTEPARRSRVRAASR